jgi:hypothetical protein
MFRIQNEFIQKMFGNAFHERIHLVMRFEVDWKGISGLSSRYACSPLAVVFG